MAYKLVVVPNLRSVRAHKYLTWSSILTLQDVMGLWYNTAVEHQLGGKLTDLRAGMRVILLHQCRTSSS